MAARPDDLADATRSTWREKVLLYFGNHWLGSSAPMEWLSFSLPSVAIELMGLLDAQMVSRSAEKTLLLAYLTSLYSRRNTLSSKFLSSSTTVRKDHVAINRTRGISDVLRKSAHPQISKPLRLRKTNNGKIAESDDKKTV